MILHTEYPKSFEMLEQASQEDEADYYEHLKQGPQSKIINDSQVINNESDDGSENAPEDSAYISDE